MYARHEEGYPHAADAQHAIEYNVLNAQLVGNEHGEKERHADGYARERNLRSIKQRYDKHRPEIVDNGQCSKENLDRQRHPAAKHIKNGQREGYVRSHRYAPPARRVASGIKREIYKGRHYHAEHGRTDRQYGVAHVGKLAANKLALKFQTYHKEEHGHQSVVNPVVKTVIKIVVAVEHKAELMFKEMKIAVAPRRVCQQKGNNNTDAEHYSARLFLIDEML